MDRGKIKTKIVFPEFEAAAGMIDQGQGRILSRGKAGWHSKKRASLA